MRSKLRVLGGLEGYLGVGGLGFRGLGFRVEFRDYGFRVNFCCKVALTIPGLASRVVS